MISGPGNGPEIGTDSSLPADEGLSALRAERGAATVIGRSSPGLLERLASEKDEVLSERPLLWVVGAAGAGKSTVVRSILAADSGAVLLHDRDYLVSTLRRRTGGPVDLSKAVVDEEVLADSFTSLASAAEQSRRAVIELARGSVYGAPGSVMSLAYALDNLPENVLRRSLFVLISADYHERIARNALRPPENTTSTDPVHDVQCSPEVMHEIFQTIDSSSLFGRSDVLSLELMNGGSRRELEKVVDILLIPDSWRFFEH